MIRNVFTKSAIAVAFALAASASVASGTDASSGAETDDAQSYNMGKGVYAQKVGCKSCPMAGKNLDVTLARDLLAGKGMPALSDQEKQSLNVYLSRRFKL